ncbi:putative RNA 2'-phosphotransferase (modular protein) [Vibrio chagasii]|nr:putative RNA 2'-phosphotransferase (modular protein) [Vibrio chagasii]
MDISNNKLKKLERIGVYLTKLLRHSPELIGLNMNENGWVSVEQLILNSNNCKKTNLDLDVLKQVVKYDSKARFTILQDENGVDWIRCEQGHSTKLVKDMSLQKETPPKFLYHGTTYESFLKIMSSDGILPMERLYVHLSSDHKTAIEVGRRHGSPHVLAIDTSIARSMGVEFYLSNNGVWLCKAIHPDCVTFSFNGDSDLVVALISDTHLEESLPMLSKRSMREFIPDCQYLPDIPNCVDVLLLAGDICELKKTELYIDALKHLCSQVPHVVAVAGNHEYWGTNYQKAEGIREELSEMFDNLHYINNEVVEINGVKIFGSTMWNNFDHDNYVISEVGRNYTSIPHVPLDARRIKWKSPRGYRKGKGEDIYKLNRTAIKSATEFLGGLEPHDKAIILSHHPLTPDICPTIQTGFDCAGLDYGLLKEKDGLVVAHGHMHGGYNYLLRTGQKAYCNPRGNFSTPEKARSYQPLIFDV